MDPLTLQNVVFACTQIALVIVGGGAVAEALRIRTPGVLYWYYRTLLAFALVLPLAQPWHGTDPRPAASVATPLTRLPDLAIQAPLLSQTDWALALNTVATFVVWTVVAGTAVRLLWLAIGFARLNRLRRAGVPMVVSAEAECLQRLFGSRADLRCVEALSHPVTFGFQRPVILLPSSLASLDLAQQRSVIAHELIHVQRRDWLWVVAEELLRAILWFHPAVWWLISRIQLTREQIVDELTVLATSNRRAYMEALLAFADRPPLAPATAFARRRHLFKRLALISKEDAMSAKRVAISCVAMAVVVAATAWYAASSFPLEAVAPGEEQAGVPGPPPPAPPPPPPDGAVLADGRQLKLERRVEPVYPAAARAAGARGQITMVLTIDAVGNVTRSVVRGIDIRTTKDVDTATLRDVTDAVIRAAADAVQHWRYEAPAATTTAYAAIAILPPGEVQPSKLTPSTRFATASERRSKAVRVGGTIKPPIKTYDVRPIYPVAAREAGIEGLVVIETLIDETGAVSEARVLQGVPLLDQAALDAVKDWKFHPTLLNGAPVPVIMKVTIDFRTGGPPR